MKRWVARARHAKGAPVVLVRRDAETDDIAALELATGLLTQRGARTSRAAVVARQLGKVCLVGCAGMELDEAARTLRIGETTLHEGQLLTLDGNDGVVYAGAVHTMIEPLLDLQDRLARLRNIHVAGPHDPRRSAHGACSKPLTPTRTPGAVRSRSATGQGCECSAGSCLLAHKPFDQSVPDAASRPVLVKVGRGGAPCATVMVCSTSSQRVAQLSVNANRRVTYSISAAVR